MTPDTGLVRSRSGEIADSEWLRVTREAALLNAARTTGLSKLAWLGLVGAIDRVLLAVYGVNGK